MFNLIDKSKGYLFASYDLREVIDNQRNSMRQEVERMEANRLLNTSPSDLTIPCRKVQSDCSSAQARCMVSR